MSYLNKLLIAVTLSLILPFSVRAATLEVGGSGPYSEIQAAINDAVDSDTVLVNDGTYIENINFLGKAITVQSVNGADVTTIDGNQSGSVVTFISGETETSILDGFTITNGSGTNNGKGLTVGGGIYCEGSAPTISSCTITGNHINGSGGGIYCKGSAPTISSCTITGNHINVSGGGIYCSYSSVVITDTVVSNNVADLSNADGISSSHSSLTMTGCSITGHDRNGLKFIFSSPSTITNCTISGNLRGIYSLNSDGQIISGCNISYNSFVGISITGSESHTITNCTISNNGPYGIDIFNSRGMTISDCTINNNAGNGIDCLSSYDQTVTNCTLNGNEYGIMSDGVPHHNITGCTMSDNIKAGVYSGDSAPDINGCTISGSPYGIKIYRGFPTITNSIIFENDYGVHSTDSNPEMINSTISNNDSVGVYFYKSDIRASDHIISISNSIIWENTDYDLSIDDQSIPGVGAYATIEYSDIDTDKIEAPAGSVDITNSISSDPLFVDAENDDYHLTLSSPCIDTGTYAGAPTDDIDGDLRPVGNGFDIGADEVLYVDNDSDGYASDIDCDDNDATIYPGAEEICDDGIDQDCNGEDLSCDDGDNDGQGGGGNTGGGGVTPDAAEGGGGGGGCFIATASYKDTRELSVFDKIIDTLISVLSKP